MKKRAEQLLPSLEQCQELLEVNAIDAMKFLMLRQEKMYQDNITKLAKICANLIACHHESPETIVNKIETIMTQNYERNVQQVIDNIAEYQKIRKNINVRTIRGEQEDDRLVARIDALHQYKKTPIADMILGVVTDTLTQAQQLHGVIVEHDNFHIDSYSPNIR